jgi:hypothetical protein
MGRKSALQKPLDELILKVHHVELAECRDFEEFKQALRIVIGNMEATLDTLANYDPGDARVRRAANNVKKLALAVMKLGREIPDSFDPPGRWREAAIHIAANYEQFRIEAGHLYQAAVPGSRFPILRSAL